MLRHVARQTASFAITFVLVMTMVFVAVRALPGDAASVRLGLEGDAAAARAIRESLDLDAPLPRQYANWWGDLARGDLGESLREGRPVTAILAERLPVTLALAASAFGLSLLVGVGLGMAAGLRPEGALDRVVLGYTTLGLALPEFWIGFVLLLLFAVRLPLLPLLGLPQDGGTGAWALHLVLPAVTLAIPRAAQLARLTRAQMLEQVRADYVRTVRAKGVPVRGQARHVAANALPGLLPLLALEAGGLLTGTIVVEQVFALPGLGLTLLGSIAARDYPVVQGITVLAVGVYVVVNALADVGQALADPRIRYA